MTSNPTIAQRLSGSDENIRRNVAQNVNLANSRLRPSSRGVAALNQYIEAVYPDGKIPPQIEEALLAAEQGGLNDAGLASAVITDANRRARQLGTNHPDVRAANEGLLGPAAGGLSPRQAPFTPTGLHRVDVHLGQLANLGVPDFLAQASVAPMAEIIAADRRRVGSNLLGDFLGIAGFGAGAITGLPGISLGTRVLK